MHSAKTKVLAAGPTAFLWTCKLDKPGCHLRTATSPRPLQLRRSRSDKSPSYIMSSKFARLGMVGKPSTEPTRRPCYLGSHPNSHADYRRVYGSLGRNYAYLRKKRACYTTAADLIHQPARTRNAGLNRQFRPGTRPLHPADAEPRSINQRELLSAILGI
jgi:hypothetical protein